MTTFKESDVCFCDHKHSLMYLKNLNFSIVLLYTKVVQNIPPKRGTKKGAAIPQQTHHKKNEINNKFILMSCGPAC